MNVDIMKPGNINKADGPPSKVHCPAPGIQAEFDRMFDWLLCFPAALSHLLFHTRPSCPLLLTPQNLWSLRMFVLHCRELLKTTTRGKEKEREREGKGRIKRKRSISLFFLSVASCLVGLKLFVGNLRALHWCVYMCVCAGTLRDRVSVSLVDF